MDERVRQLELKLQSLKQHNDALSQVDAFERWGAQHADPGEIDRSVELGRTSSIERDRITEALTAEVNAFRATAPEVLTAWVEGHVTLLVEFGAAPSNAGLLPEIEREVKSWREVLTGPRAFVDPWATALRIDGARRVEMFGV
jgi:hypothetical protein